MHRLWNALTMMVGLWVVLACGLDADDRMVRVDTPDVWRTPTPLCIG